MAISKVILNSDVQMDITDTTATQGQVASTAYYYGADGVKKQGSYVVPSAVTQATPTISVNSSTGLITASATQSAGVVSAGTKSATEQLSTEAGKTVTPTTSEQTAVAANKYTLGAIKVAAMPAGSAATPATSITANPSISVSSGGLITATASATKSVTPTVSAGYVSSGTAGTITVSGSNTEQLTTQAAQTLYPSTTDQTISSGKYLTGAQTVKGVLLTNLDAGNIKKDVVVKVGDSADDDRITSVTGTYEGSGGGGTADYKAFIDRSTNTPTLPSDLTTIGDYACYSWKTLALTSLPNTTTTIGANAFSSCNALPLTALPSSLTYIGAGAFMSCWALAISTIPDGVTYIGANAFQNCENIQTITCNGAISTLGSGAFVGNATHPMTLQEVHFPNLTGAINITTFGNSTAAAACQQLEVADLGKATTIGANAFANCYKLQTLILRRTAAICSLSNTSAFNNTPMSGYNSLTGTVYVPNALISTYQTASNWKTVYDAGYISFVKIEGSIYE